MDMFDLSTLELFYNFKFLLKGNFNATEAAFFLYTSKTFNFKWNACAGGSRSIIVLVSSDMAGCEKLKLLIIGWSNNPCYVLKEQPFDYILKAKVWVSQDIFVLIKNLWYRNYIITKYFSLHCIFVVLRV